MVSCIKIDRDCAELYYVSAKFLIGDSAFAHQLLVLCEKACRHCAEEVTKLVHEHCKRCGDKCCQCAEEKKHLSTLQLLK